jgi:hypothetical protein
MKLNGIHGERDSFFKLFLRALRGKNKCHSKDVNCTDRDGAEWMKGGGFVLDKNTRKILFGLCQLDKKTGDTIICSAPELNWLVENPVSKATGWPTPGGRFRSSGGKSRDGEVILDRKTRLEDKIDRYLSDLEKNGFISYRKTDFLYRINIRAEGFERAKPLESKKGRISLWLGDNTTLFIYLAVVAALVLAGLIYAGYFRE